MREKVSVIYTDSRIEYQENKLKAFQRTSTQSTSYRVYEADKVGIYCHIGQCGDEEGYEKAKENLLERARPYPFEIESGVRKRDMTERELTDKELMNTAKECMDYLMECYPKFIHRMIVNQSKEIYAQTNDKGMDYEYIDCCVSVMVEFKHVDSKDISNGYFSFSLRDYDKEVFQKMADNYLANYDKELELPEEIIIDMQYYDLLGKLYSCLNYENMSLGTSLLSGKIGEKVFSGEFTLMHDVSEKECWFNRFWDGDGCVHENDKFVYIENGVLLSGFSDKRTSKKYNVPHTKNAYHNDVDIPGPGGLNLRIKRSEKKVKELLNGRYCIIPAYMGGGGFADNGDYAVPIQYAFLSDGEKILGRVPAFTMVSNLFDIFGKDFVGVGSDNPIYNDKQILFRVKKGEI